MNELNRQIRSSLLRKYYKSATLGWFQPRSMHWAKIVTQGGHWKWIRADRGIRGRILKFPPLHIYQTLLKFQTKDAPRGRETEGFLLGGPYLFESDVIDYKQPFSLWRLMDSCNQIAELSEVLTDRLGGKIERVMFSGYRGIHVTFSHPDQSDIPLVLNGKQGYQLKDFQRERTLTARMIGYWSRDWDWEVSSDIWRVTRVPWSIHSRSALRAIPLRQPVTPSRIRNQLRESSPFSFDKTLKVRITRDVPLFTFVDGESYGPYRKHWSSRLPIAVALHLIWLDMAKPREKGSSNHSSWFERGWQILFRKNAPEENMVTAMTGGIRTG